MRQRYELGDDVRTRLREHLNLWNTTLAQQLTDSLDLDGGQLFAYLPVGLTPKDLSLSALQRVRGNAAMYKPLNELIRRHLQKNDAILIVPEALLNKEDIKGKVHAPLTAFYKGEVYYALTDYPTNDGSIRQILRVTEDWQYIGVLTYAPKLRGRTGEADLSLDDIDMLAARAETIIYDPFDGEGYAIWEKEIG